MSNKSSSCNSNGRSAVTRVPVEVLLIVFHFVGPSTRENPYPYLPLSWVCRLWRSVICEDSRFWTVRYMTGESFLNPTLDITEGTSWHPDSRAIDLVIHSDDDLRILSDWSTVALEEFFSRASFREQIRTLLFPGNQLADFDINVPLEEFSFPRLEKLTVSLASFYYFGGQLSALIVGSPRLRYMELPCYALYHFQAQNLSHHLSRIEWLKLEGVTAVLATMYDLLKSILENMPNLQILIMTSMQEEEHVIPQSAVTTTNTPAIQLPAKLRIFSLEFNFGDIWTFRAPNLDYLSVINLGFNNEGPLDKRARTFNNWGLLDSGSLDFSKITNILVGLHAVMSEKMEIKRSDVMKRSVACISASNCLLLDCLSFKHFHEDGLNSRPLLDDYLDLPSNNCFHIPFRWKSPSERFYSILSRATNLVELTLHCGAINSKGNSDYYSFLENVLDSVAGERITSLNIIQGRSFITVCNLLEGRRTPRLERLMYHSAFWVKRITSLPRHLKILQNSRSQAGLQALKTLKLGNFADVPLKRVREIEDLGVRLIVFDLI